MPVAPPPSDPNPRPANPIGGVLAWFNGSEPLPDSVRQVLVAASRSAEVVATEAMRMTVKAVRTYREAVLVPLLAALRSGTSVRQDLQKLFSEILEAPDDVIEQTFTEPVPTTGASTQTEDPPGLDDLPPELASIGQAIREGVDRAVEEGWVTPAGSADAVAWALTSLLVTLIMRSREGEDTQSLIDAATRAIDGLLAGGTSR